MRKLFEKELSNVTTHVIDMGQNVDATLKKVINALKNKDLSAAKEIINNDDFFDEMEVSIEEECVDIIATQHPMASDLRRITTVLRIITDLERIADHCVNISKVVLSNNGRDFMKPLVDLPRMQELCSIMISGAIESFTKEDEDLAKRIINMDDEVDELYERVYSELLGMLSENHNLKDQVVLLLLIGRYLERIADHATNVAEKVVYMVSGKRYKN